MALSAIETRSAVTTGLTTPTLSRRTRTSAHEDPRGTKRQSSPDLEHRSITPMTRGKHEEWGGNQTNPDSPWAQSSPALPNSGLYGGGLESKWLALTRGGHRAVTGQVGTVGSGERCQQ